MAKLGISDLEVADTFPKDISFDDNPTMVKKNNQLTKKKKITVEDNDEEINLSDFGSDSESSGAEEEHLEK